MKITFDPDKSLRNLMERDLPFERAAEFEFETARYWLDDRHDYGETRYLAVGYLGKRLHILVYSETEDGIRVISFRKANDREGRRYGLAQKRH